MKRLFATARDMRSTKRQLRQNLGDVQTFRIRKSVNGILQNFIFYQFNLHIFRISM